MNPVWDKVEWSEIASSKSLSGKEFLKPAPIVVFLIKVEILKFQFRIEADENGLKTK